MLPTTYSNQIQIHVGHLITDTKTKEIIALRDITGKAVPTFQQFGLQGRLGPSCWKAPEKTGPDLLPV